MCNKKLIGLAASLLLAPAVWAQPPAVPAVPGAPAAAPTSNLWSFLLPTSDQKLACKTSLCNSALGQMLAGAAGPASAMSGGLLPNCCQQTALANALKQPADTPDGMAARAQKDAEEAQARRAAVRYLGTLDCNYWPDAMSVLITALRGDRCECVRFEAALAFQRGCCCNAKVVKALTICVSGGTDDGFPSEHSDRVRAAAADALSGCVLPVTPQKEAEKEHQNVRAPAPTDPATYYHNVAQMPRDEVVASAQAVLAHLQTPGQKTAVVAYPVSNQQRRPGSVAGIFSNAFAPQSGPVVANATPAPANAPVAASQLARPMPGTLVSVSKPSDRQPAAANLAAAPVAATPTGQTSAPRQQSLVSILSRIWSRPQEATPAGNPEPRPVEVSNPMPSSPSSNGTAGLPYYAPRVIPVTAPQP